MSLLARFWPVFKRKSSGCSSRKDVSTAPFRNSSWFNTFKINGILVLTPAWWKRKSKVKNKVSLRLRKVHKIQEAYRERETLVKLEPSCPWPKRDPEIWQSLSPTASRNTARWRPRWRRTLHPTECRNPYRFGRLQSKNKNEKRKRNWNIFWKNRTNFI